MFFEQTPYKHPSRVDYFAALYRDRSDFDAELFREAVRQLDRERREARSVQEQLVLDHTRFLDAFHPSEPVSALETATLIPPLPFYQAELRTLAHEPRTLFSTSGTSASEIADRYCVRTYGTEVLHRILAGVLFCAPASEADSIGTSQLDCCQALAGRRADGTLLLGHIPGPSLYTLQHGFEIFTRLLDAEKLVLFYPFLPEDGYVREEDAAQAKATNATFQVFAETHDIEALPFASSAVPGRRKTPAPYAETAVTVSRYGISLGTHIVKSNPRKHGEALYIQGPIRTYAW